MVPYDNFLGRLLNDVPGVPELGALQAIRDACIDFCEKTLIHQADHDPVSVIAKLADYDLETPAEQTKVIRILKAWYKGDSLDPVAPDYVTDPALYNQNIGGYTTRYSTPKVITQKDTTTFSLYPPPDLTVASAITMRVALAPLRDSDSCADFLYENWVDDICAGAAARLQASPNKGYSNPQFAASNQKRYMAGVNDARMRSNRGLTRANMQVKLRRI